MSPAVRRRFGGRTAGAARGSGWKLFQGYLFICRSAPSPFPLPPPSPYWLALKLNRQQGPFEEASRPREGRGAGGGKGVEPLIDRGDPSPPPLLQSKHFASTDLGAKDAFKGVGGQRILTVFSVLVFLSNFRKRNPLLVKKYF